MSFIWNLIKAFPHMDWDYETLSKNPTIQQENLEEIVEQVTNKQIKTILYISSKFSRSIVGNMHTYKRNKYIIWYSMDHFVKSIHYRNKNMICSNIINVDFCSEKTATMSYVLENLSRRWNWKELSMSRQITSENISSNIELPWIWYFVMKNPNITMRFLLDNQDRFWKCAWSSASENLAITVQDIIDNSQIIWNWDNIAKRKDLTMCDINRINADTRNRPLWNKEILSSNPNLTIEFLLANLKNTGDNSKFTHHDWKWDLVTSNPGILIEDILNNVNSGPPEFTPIPWNWNWLSANPNLTMEFISSTMLSGDQFTIPWSWIMMSRNKGDFGFIKLLTPLLNKSIFRDPAQIVIEFTV